jgi:hypothetical protein
MEELLTKNCREAEMWREVVLVSAVQAGDEGCAEAAFVTGHHCILSVRLLTNAARDASRVIWPHNTLFLPSGPLRLFNSLRVWITLHV